MNDDDRAIAAAALGAATAADVAVVPKATLRRLLEDAERFMPERALRRQVERERLAGLRLQEKLGRALSAFSALAADTRAHPAGCLCAVLDRRGVTCWARHNDARTALEEWRAVRGMP